MDCQVRIRFLLTLFCFHWLYYTTAFPQRSREGTPERRVVFPINNSTGRRHSLPVFPEPVIDFVGKIQPVAPPVDEFGNPLCASDASDTFCERVDDYPDETIRQAVKYSTDEFKDLFGGLNINPRKIAPGDPSEESVCKQQSRMFYPKAAVNGNDQWAYVVNDIDYVQAVTAEMCEKEDKPCNYMDGALPAGVSSRCRQKFAYKRMLALHPNHKKTYTDAFRFPSCCVCYVTRPFVLSRTQLARGFDDSKDK